MQCPLCGSTTEPVPMSDYHECRVCEVWVRAVTAPHPPKAERLPVQG
jgi:hypothetical protein